MNSSGWLAVQRLIRQIIRRQLVEHAVSLDTRLGFKTVDVAVFADNAAMLCLLLTFSLVPVPMTHLVRPDASDVVYMNTFL